MENVNLVSVTEFCRFHHLDSDFMRVLEQNGLIETMSVEETNYVQTGALTELEKLVRLHQDLSIGAENLDIIAGLLQRMENLQEQIKHLRRRLAFYEHFENNASQDD